MTDKTPGGSTSQVDRVIPLLVYEDIPAAHDFLVLAFGFEPGGVYNNDEGKPVHAILSVIAGGSQLL